MKENIMTRKEIYEEYLKLISEPLAIDIDCELIKEMVGENFDKEKWRDQQIKKNKKKLSNFFSNLTEEESENLEIDISNFSFEFHKMLGKYNENS
jgi:hypothetical protein